MPDPNRTRSVTLIEKHHETLMTAALDQISTSATIAEEKAVDLRDTSPRDASLVDDTRLAFRVLREDLDALDALGWPDDPERRGGRGGPLTY